jgi:hypothetical protein
MQYRADTATNAQTSPSPLRCAIFYWSSKILKVYKKFKDLDLITVYSTMLSTSGEISVELKDEIDRRFGMDYFKRIIDFRKSNFDEYSRIQGQVVSLCSNETNFEFVRRLISSDFLSNADLDIFVLRAFTEQKNKLLDETVDRSTISLSIIGLFAGCIPAAIFWWGLMSLIKQPIVLAIPIAFIISFFVIKILTKKSIKNPVVLTATVLSGLIGLGIGHILYMVSQ